MSYMKIIIKMLNYQKQSIDMKWQSHNQYFKYMNYNLRKVY